MGHQINYFTPVSGIPDGLNSTSCFIKKDGEIVSPCGKNSVCYDESSIVGNNTLAGTAFCGCMENYVGDPYTACELLQTCSNTNTSNCTEKQKCEGGFCRHIPGTFNFILWIILLLNF